MRIKVGDLVKIKEEHVDHEIIHDDLGILYGQVIHLLHLRQSGLAW